MSRNIQSLLRVLMYMVLVAGVLLGVGASAPAGLVVDDSWADGGRTNGADPLDTGWWSSTSETGNSIEVTTGSLGLVSGSSGRGIHGTFAAQTLAVGDTLVATFTFTTPANLAAASQAGFKIGLFSSQGSSVAADITASSGSPNALYNPVLGYMMDFDVTTTTSDNITFRERTVASGQLLATTNDFTTLGSGGADYSFAINTSYTGVYSITRTASGLELSGTLSSGVTLLSTSGAIGDLTPSTNTFDMLGFHANSGVFGTSNTPGTANNGIDFSNIRIEYIAAIPEPSAFMIGGLIVTLAGFVAARRRLAFRHPRF